MFKSRYIPHSEQPKRAKGEADILAKPRTPQTDMDQMALVRASRYMDILGNTFAFGNVTPRERVLELLETVNDECWEVICSTDHGKLDPTARMLRLRMVQTMMAYKIPVSPILAPLLQREIRDANALKRKSMGDATAA